MKPNPNRVTPGSPCWYKPYKSSFWYVGRFQQWVTYATIEYARAIVVTLDGIPIEVADNDIQFSSTDPNLERIYEAP